MPADAGRVNVPVTIVLDNARNGDPDSQHTPSLGLEPRLKLANRGGDPLHDHRRSVLLRMEVDLRPGELGHREIEALDADPRLADVDTDHDTEISVDSQEHARTAAVGFLRSN